MPPARELPRQWFAMTRLALWLLAVGCLLVALSFVAWFLMLLPTSDALRPILAVFYDRWTLAFGLLGMAFGVAAWTRAWVASERVAPLLGLLVGVVLVAFTGYREVHAPASATPQVLHAVIGLGALTLLLVGIVQSPRAFGPVARLFRLEQSSQRLGWWLRLITYVSLALGVLVPFAPRFFGDATPHACALRVAATGALLLSVPLFASTAGLILFERRLMRSRDAVATCLACGYPRPAATTCPECGA